MKQLFAPGDIKVYRKTVAEQDAAAFETGKVHDVYATFALARDAEWVCRLFVLDLKEEDEEGIGTYVSVKHVAPAKVGQEVVFEAQLVSIVGNTVTCTYQTKVGNTLVAEGEQVQKVLKKEKLKAILG